MSCKTAKNNVQHRQTLQLQNRSSAPKRKRTILKYFEALFKRIVKEITSAKIERKLLRPIQYNLRCPAAKHKSITRTAAAAEKIQAAVTRPHSCSRRHSKQPGGTKYVLKRPKPQPPHTQAALHRRLQPLCPRKYNVLCSGCPPQQAPCNIHAAIAMHLQRHLTNPHVSTHMATKYGNNHAAIPLPSANTDSKTRCNYAHMNNCTLQSTLEEPITF